MSLPEFQDYVESKKPACFVYSTANQTNIHSTLSVMNRYSQVKVSLNSMRVMFLGSCGYLCINFVSHVEISENDDGSTEWIEFVCAVHGKKTQDRYCIIAEF